MKTLYPIDGEQYEAESRLRGFILIEGVSVQQIVSKKI